MRASRRRWRVSVNNGAALVQTGDVHAVGFSLAGLDTDDSGTLTFTDGTQPPSR